MCEAGDSRCEECQADFDRQQAQHFSRAARIVRSWPAWKQTLLGGPASPVLELVVLTEPGPLLAPFLRNPMAEREIGALLLHVPGKLWVVATLDGVPAGCGALFLPAGASATELASGYVLPAHRGIGIYSTLVDARLVIAADRPVVTAKCRPLAAETLARRGFVTVGHEDGYAVMRLERPRRRDPDWLEKIVNEAVHDVRSKPPWLRSAEVQVHLDNLDRKKSDP
jgi:GNAT superfamily N-acetyltransferase